MVYHSKQQSISQLIAVQTFPPPINDQYETYVAELKFYVRGQLLITILTEPLAVQACLDDRLKDWWKSCCDDHPAYLPPHQHVHPFNIFIGQLFFEEAIDAKQADNTLYEELLKQAVRFHSYHAMEEVTKSHVELLLNAIKTNLPLPISIINIITNHANQCKHYHGSPGWWLKMQTDLFLASYYRHVLNNTDRDIHYKRQAIQSYNHYVTTYSDYEHERLYAFRGEADPQANVVGPTMDYAVQCIYQIANKLNIEVEESVNSASTVTIHNHH